VQEFTQTLGGQGQAISILKLIIMKSVRCITPVSARSAAVSIFCHTQQKDRETEREKKSGFRLNLKVSFTFYLITQN
jgi:hypothetical protein